MLGAGIPIHSAQVLPTFRTSANKVPVSTKIIILYGISIPSITLSTSSDCLYIFIAYDSLPKN